MNDMRVNAYCQTSTKTAQATSEGNTAPILIHLFHQIHPYLHADKSSFLTLKNFYQLSLVNRFFLTYVSNTLSLVWQIKPCTLTTHLKIRHAMLNSTPREIKKIWLQLCRFNLSLDRVDPLLQQHTLIVSAVRYNCFALTKLALASGASPNAYYYAEPYQRIPLLTYAAIFGQIKIVQTLITARANVDEHIAGEQATALTCLVRELLRSAPSTACTHGYGYKMFVLQRFNQRKNKVEQQKACMHALLTARKHMNQSELDILLMEASHADHNEIMQMLIAAKANVNARNHCGNRPLAYASYRGKLAAMHTLLEARAEIHSVLFGTARHGQADALQLLINAKAIVNDKNQEGNTAILYGIWYSHVAVVQTLLNARADPSISDVRGNNGFDYAEHKQNPEIIHLLQQGKAEKLYQSKIVPLKRSRSEAQNLGLVKIRI